MIGGFSRLFGAVQRPSFLFDDVVTKITENALVLVEDFVRLDGYEYANSQAPCALMDEAGRAASIEKKRG